MPCKFWQWLSGAAHHLKVDIGKIAVAITEDIQFVLKSGVLTGLATAVEKLFPSVHNIPTDILAKLNDVVPKVLAAELGLVGLPDSPTEKDILDFEEKVLKAFNIHDNKSKLYTTMAGTVYGILKERAEDGTTYTWYEIVSDVEKAYQKLKELQAGEEAA